MYRIFSTFVILLLLTWVTGAKAQRKNLLASSTAVYNLDVKVMPDKNRLETSGTMRLPAAAVSRPELRLSLSELMQNFTVEVLEPAASAGTARVEKRDASGRNVKWIVRPVRPIPAGEKVTLKFSYAGGERIANQFYIGSEVSFASAWGTDWYPLIDGENDKAIGMLRFSVPAGQTLYANGSRRSSTQEAEQGIFRFEIAHPTYFTFAAGSFNIVRRNGSVPIAAYMLKPRPNTEQYLDSISRILDVLIKEFGKYPFDEFVLVEIPRDLALKASFNGAATQGFVLLNSRAFDVPDVKYALNFLGHEFSHQWFPHTVALKTPPGLFMEEALAEYGGLRVVEVLSGDEAAEKYRRTGFEYDPYFSILEYFKLVGAGVDHPLGDLQQKPKHRELAYHKGFLVWNMLSREIGREKFQHILHSITRRYAFKEIGWNEFLHVIEKGAGRNLQWFYKQWFERPGAPEFELTWKQEKGKLSGVINQTSPYYQAALEIEPATNQGQHTSRIIRVRGAKTSFSFSIDFRADSVALDPHYLILRWTPEYRKEANAIRSSGQKNQ